MQTGIPRSAEPRPNPPRPKTTTQAPDGDRPRPSRDGAPIYLKVLRVFLYIFAVGVLIANLDAYDSLIRMLLPISGDACQKMARFPLLGQVLQWGCFALVDAAIASLGFVAWAVIQLIELLPIAANYNLPFIGRIIQRIQGAPKVQIEGADSAEVRRWKRKYNTATERSLTFLNWFACATYIADLWAMFALYTPFTRTGGVDGLALGRVLLGVFGVEVILVAITFLNNVIDPSSIKFPTAKQKPVREY